LPDKFDAGLMSRHAVREAVRERIPLDMIAQAYEDPDVTRPSNDDDLREIRTRWFGGEGVEVVVDAFDGRIVTTWRRGLKP
jgi:hypothetical protein